MNKKWIPYLLILLLAAAVIVIKQLQKKDKTVPKPTITTNDKRDDPAGNKTNRDRGFDRRASYLEYSKHAQCRMDCRKISKAEVEGIMKDGKINYNKSDLQNARCPRYAVEGVTKDDQHTRIVFAQCNESTVVVTVIDLETDFDCNCPGDDDGSIGSPHKNRN